MATASELHPRLATVSKHTRNINMNENDFNNNHNLTLETPDAPLVSEHLST